MKTIVCIENNTSVTESYVNLIQNSKQFQVIASFNTYESVFKKIKKLHPDILLIDIDLPGINSIEHIKYIKNTLPEIKIIVVTKMQDPGFVFDALSAGALGYLIKDDTLQIINALEQLDKGGAPMSNAISKIVVESFQEYRFKELTKRENEILKLLTEGKSYSSIAEKLFVSHNTVKYHLRNIYEKLNIYCRAEAIKLVNSKKGYLKTG